jgi:hypothetical protein
LTKCSDLSEAEAEETEMVVVAVKTVRVIETAAVMITMVVLTVKAAAALKTAATVMTTAKTVAVVITDEKGNGRRHIGGNSGT